MIYYHYQVIFYPVPTEPKYEILGEFEHEIEAWEEVAKLNGFPDYKSAEECLDRDRMNKIFLRYFVSAVERTRKNAVLRIESWQAPERLAQSLGTWGSLDMVSWETLDAVWTALARSRGTQSTALYIALGRLGQELKAPNPDAPHPSSIVLRMENMENGEITTDPQIEVNICTPTSGTLIGFRYNEKMGRVRTHWDFGPRGSIYRAQFVAETLARLGVAHEVIAVPD